MGDSDDLRAAITAATRVVVIGSGWIGSEVAASARPAGDVAATWNCMYDRRIRMEYNGYASEWDRVVVRKGTSVLEFLAFWLKDGRVLAAMNANIWDQGDNIKALVGSGATIDVDRLADPSTPLADLTFRA